MKWWLVGGTVALAAGVALALPVWPAATMAEAPVEFSERFTSEEHDACFDLDFDATLSGLEHRPALTALPWSRWTEVSLGDDVVMRVSMPEGCEAPHGTVERIEGHVIVGKQDCGQWDLAPGGVDVMPVGTTTTGCDGQTVYFHVATDAPDEGSTMHTGLLDGELWGGSNGCLDVTLYGVVEIDREGGAFLEGMASDADRAAGADGSEPSATICLPTARES
ncbi:hypothetical protein [Demequina activiva]|uniref:Uncharacterized protein n=1 Tax=Demequina activiva TaxID=1582364 RepID=A0A919Q582_9MICO|nr:hypothetical protein [Demequina activiva]GIG54743.1 hypothetical protein Dac01nite_14950 [Demequina activiva]